MQPSTEVGELEPIEWAGYDDPLLFRECFILYCVGASGTSLGDGAISGIVGIGSEGSLSVIASVPAALALSGEAGCIRDNRRKKHVCRQHHQKHQGYCQDKAGLAVHLTLSVTHALSAAFISALAGTGSDPNPPQGWQRPIRRMASQVPSKGSMQLNYFNRIFRARGDKPARRWCPS